ASRCSTWPWTWRPPTGAGCAGSRPTTCPKWFDKDPARTFRDNVEDELRAIASAEAAYLDAGRAPRPMFDLWQDAYGECARRAPGLGLNGLTAAFGSSLFERALADAAGRLS